MPPPPTGPSADYRRYVASLVLFHLAAADAAGMGATDFQAWNVLDLDGPLTSGELARRLGLTTGATTRLIDRLESSGAARRVPDPADRRRVLVESTGGLPDPLAATLATVREPIGRALGGLDEAERAGVAAYFRAAADAYAAAAQAVR